MKPRRRPTRGSSTHCTMRQSEEEEEEEVGAAGALMDRDAIRLCVRVYMRARDDAERKEAAGARGGMKKSREFNEKEVIARATD